MDRGHVFRRMFHLCAPAILIYYLLPDVFLGLSRELWLMVGLLLLLILEAGRLYSGRIFFGMREYERTQISAYAWAGMGVGMAFLLFPMPLVVAAVTGLSWTDPLIGELRKRSRLRLYPSLPMAIYFLIVIASLEMFSDMPLLAIVILASVGSIGAIAAEKPKIPVDDDFIMLVLPLVIMTLVYEYMVIADLARI